MQGGTGVNQQLLWHFLSPKSARARDGVHKDGLLRDSKRRATAFAIRHDAAANQARASEVQCKDTPGFTLSSPGGVE